MRWIALLTVYGLLTLSQAWVYQSALSIWSQAVTHAPTFRAWVNYRTALLQAGDIEGAVAACEAMQATSRTGRDDVMLARLCFGVPWR